MFKLWFCLNTILNLIILNEGKSFTLGDLNDNSLTDDTHWKNLWFPMPPNYENKVKPDLVNAEAAVKSAEGLSDKTVTSEWPGLWLPYPPNYQNYVSSDSINVAAAEKNTRKEDLSDKSKRSDWQDLWFPYPPNYHDDKIVKESSTKLQEKQQHICDNGKYYLNVDFDPEDKRHSFNYLCLGKRSEYAPNLNTSALLKEHFIPVAYEPPIKCLNESIEYEELIPTFGAFRPLAPKFGSYRYMPPQRWLHSLADGAIVLLYHPCAFAGQVEQLKNTLKGCLYRHVITPSQLLTPQYPLAILAWGKSLQMSVVDDAIAVKFIKDNAKKGFRENKQNLKISSKLYDAALLNEAHLVTDEQDNEICGYKDMR